MADHVIRGYEPGDEAPILELFARAFHHRRDLAHWAWKYRDSPYGSLRISVAVDADGAMVAHYAGYPVPFVRAGRSATAHQIGDMMTRPDARGIGRRSTGLMTRTARDFYDRFCAGRVAFNYGFQAGHGRKFSLLLLGAERVEPVPFRVRELGTHPLRAPGRWRRWRRGLAVETVDAVDQTWDAFFRDVAPAYGWLVERDARYVGWRYLRRPDGQYLLLAVKRRRALVGWGVFTRRDDVLTCGDALVHPDHAEAAALLLAAASASPLGLGARRIQGWFPARPAWFGTLLDDLGFRLAPEPEDLALMCVPWLERDAAAQMRRDLYYTYGDSDLF